MWVTASKKFLVSLRPIGIDYRRETTASNANKAVTNVLYYYLGKNREKLQIYIFRMRQELGEDGWDRKVSEMADEVVEEGIAEEPAIQQEVVPDEQLELFEFQKSVDKEHPGAAIAGAWKESHSMKFVTIDKLKDLVDDAEVTTSVKLDGELVCLYFRGEVAEVVTAKGTVRTSLPPTEEARTLLANYKEAAFMGELHVVNEKEIPQSYTKVSSALKNPDKGMDDSIRLSIFDIISIDGKTYENVDMQTKTKEIENIFGKGKFIRPATTVYGNMSEAEKLWDQLDERGWEGLVVYFGDTIYKTKPIMSFDMVVVAVVKSDKLVDRISAIVTSFIDKEGRFRLSGSIGGGMTDEERNEFKAWAERNKIMEDDEKIWVDPYKEPMIIEVEAVEVNVKKEPKLDFKDGKWVQIEDDWSGTLRFPQLERVRDDKEPKYPDARIEQLPISSSALPVEIRPGRYLKDIHGNVGRIQPFAPREGGLGFDIVVEWTPPLFGVVEASSIHPTEIVSVWD